MKLAGLEEHPDFGNWSSRASEAVASNRYADALVWIDKVLAVRPRDVQALNARGTALGALGRFDEAITSFERAAAERPGDPHIRYNIALTFQRQDRYQEALTHFDRALALSPGYAEALNSRGFTLDALGRYDEAVASLEKAATLRPRDPHPRFNLGNAHLGAGKLIAAREAFEAALMIDPRYSDARLNLGRCLNLMGHFDDAARHFRVLLAESPDHSGAVEGLAEIYRYLDRDDEFVEDCRRLLERVPTAASAWLELGVSLAVLNRRENASECFSRALALQPKNALLHARIGSALIELGDLDEAQRFFTTACMLQPKSPLFWHSLVRVKKVTSNDGLVDALERVRLECDVSELPHIHFALGKAFADIGDNDRSFSHYLEGNKRRRRQIPYDEGKALAKMTRTAELFSPAIVQHCGGAGNQSTAPIFVLGMPRTGSTLVEQILAAHGQVLALGELKSFEQAVGVMNRRKGSTFPEWLGHLDSSELAELADDYLSRLFKVARARDPSFAQGTVSRIVDKMPGNFQYVGLIRLAFPNARIIHTGRDPIDTCLSCFQSLFGSVTVPYSYDLAELGRYYAHYERLMAAWSEALPAHSFLNVGYESLVNEFERVAREIVSYCGLEWDEACLSFHKAQRPVRTVSATQVRKPLFSTSLRKWRPSDEILQPLLQALGRTSAARE